MISDELSVEDWLEKLKTIIMINRFRNHIKNKKKIDDWKQEFIEDQLEIRYEYEYMKMEYRMLNPLDFDN